MSKDTPKRHEVKMSYQAIAAALVRANNIREGHWSVALTFASPVGINANINGMPRLLPAAVVPVLGISLIRVEQPTDLSVDAAQCNPQSRIITAGVLN